MVLRAGAGDEEYSCWLLDKNPDLSGVVPADPNEAREVCHLVTALANELGNVVQYLKEKFNLL